RFRSHPSRRTVPPRGPLRRPCRADPHVRPPGHPSGPRRRTGSAQRPPAAPTPAPARTAPAPAAPQPPPRARNPGPVPAHVRPSRAGVTIFHTAAAAVPLVTTLQRTTANATAARTTALGRVSLV